MHLNAILARPCPASSRGPNSRQFAVGAHSHSPRFPQGLRVHASHSTLHLRLALGSTSAHGCCVHCTERCCIPHAAPAPGPTAPHCAKHFPQPPTAHQPSSHNCPLHGRCVAALLLTECPQSLSNTSADTLAPVKPAGSNTKTSPSMSSHVSVLQRHTHAHMPCTFTLVMSSCMHACVESRCRTASALAGWRRLNGCTASCISTTHQQ